MRPNLGHTLAMVICCATANATAARADLITSTKTLAPEIFELGTEPKQALAANLDKAIKLFRERQYDQAFQILRDATGRNPDLPPARLMLARMFIANNQAPLGRAALETAAIENPKYPGIYLVFGDLALDEGRVTDALTHFEKAANLTRAEHWSDRQRHFFLIQYHAGMATVAERRRDWPAARDELAAWLKLHPFNAQARQRLGRALFQLGQLDEAEQELERATKDDPTLQPTAVTLGWLYTQKGDLDKAADWMEQAVKRAPRDPKAHLGRAAWLLHQGKTDEAEAQADAAALDVPKVARPFQADPITAKEPRPGKADPITAKEPRPGKADLQFLSSSNSKELSMLRGLIALYRKDFSLAERHIQPVHEGSPDDFLASNYLALALVEQSDDAKRTRALELAEGNVGRNPRSAQALATLGWVYYRLGKLEAAERVLLTTMADGEVAPDSGYYLARVLADRGRPDQARQFLKKALESPGGFLWHKEAQEWSRKLEGGE